MTNATQATLLNPLVAKVGEIAAAHARSRLPQLRAVIMIGSMARSEATWKRTSSGWEVLGDAEFVIVQDDTHANKIDVSNLCQEIEAELAAQGIRCKIDISLVGSEWLAKLGPTIFAYEVRTTGRVVYGDDSVLDLAPQFPSSSIDRQDAWRLICNRLVEWLEKNHDAEQRQYRGAKLLLDCASSFLVFTSNFESGYENRAQKIRSSNNAAGLPVDHQTFSDLVWVCTEYKLGRRESLPDLSTIAPTIALRLAEWEEVQINTSPNFFTRLRAWAFVVRATGWLRGWAHWPKWSLLALRTTPRRLVYRAAHQLTKAALGEISFQKALVSVRDLPVSSNALASHAEACQQIAFNYNEFVLKSRA